MTVIGGFIMGFNQLSNCPKCGKLFVKGMRDVCNDCFKIDEEEYKIVTTYLKQRENRKASLYEVSDATGVSVKQITRFVRQGRISLKDFPNMGAPCDSCGQPASSGNLCVNCKNKFTKEIESFVEKEEKRMEKDKLKVKDIGYLHIKDK